MTEDSFNSYIHVENNYVYITCIEYVATPWYQQPKLFPSITKKPSIGEVANPTMQGKPKNALTHQNHCLKGGTTNMYMYTS